MERSERLVDTNSASGEMLRRAQHDNLLRTCGATTRAVPSEVEESRFGQPAVNLPDNLLLREPYPHTFGLSSPLESFFVTVETKVQALALDRPSPILDAAISIALHINHSPVRKQRRVRGDCTSFCLRATRCNAHGLPFAFS